MNCSATNGELVIYAEFRLLMAGGWAGSAQVWRDWHRSC